MRRIFTRVILIFGLFVCSISSATNTYFAGIQMGSTSKSSSNGATERDSSFSYGAQGYLVYNHWLGGLNYKTFSPDRAGTNAITVNQTDHWVQAEGLFRLLVEDFSPYASVGVGPIFQSVTTNVMGSSETAHGTYWVMDAGLGFLGKLSQNVGVNFGVKYFQFLNVTGFDYSVSLGFFPE